MSNQENINKFKKPYPIIVSVLCIITIICAVTTVDNYFAVSPTDTPLDVTLNNTPIISNTDEVSSVVEVVENTSPISTPPPYETLISTNTFTPQGDVSPTDVSAKICYLTFDDGPSDNTLEILNILRIYNVKATFFVMETGKLEYTKHILAEGHTIGLHCNSHDYSTVYASPTAYYNDLKTISDKVENICGVKSNIIRFPGGSSNSVSKKYCPGIMTQLTQELPQLGYFYFDWNTDSGDASGNNVSVSRMLSKIQKYKPKDKVVVLMHDSSAKRTTVDVLPHIIEYYMNAGYYLAPLSQDSEPVRHNIINN